MILNQRHMLNSLSKLLQLTSHHGELLWPKFFFTAKSADTPSASSSVTALAYMRYIYMDICDHPKINNHVGSCDLITMVTDNP